MEFLTDGTKPEEKDESPPGRSRGAEGKAPRERQCDGYLGQNSDVKTRPHCAVRNGFVTVVTEAADVR